MKNILLKLVFLIGIGVGLGSCVNFLDQTPEAATYNEDNIFTSYDLSQRFIDQLYLPFKYFDDNDWTGGKENNPGYGGFVGKSMYGLRERISDNCFATSSTWHVQTGMRNGGNNTGNGSYFADSGTDRFSAMWKAIRVCNLSIANVDRITNITDEQKAKILGSAYFLRGHFYFMLLQGWGGMPYITAPIDPAENMDFPRLTYSETAKKIAEDFDKAGTYLPMVVDNTDWGRPSKMACYAYKGKALLWGASPYSNPENDKTLWANAAVALGTAIKEAEASGYYHMVTLSDFKKLFQDCVEETYHDVLFGRLFPNEYANGAPYYCGIKSVDFGKAWTGAESVTENLAACYTWSNGDPVVNTTDEYKNSPYFGDGTTHTGRDPRFYETVIFNTAKTPQVAAKSRVVQIWNKSLYSGVAQTIDGVIWPAGTVSATSPSDVVVDTKFVATGGWTYTGYYNWKLFSQGFVTKGNVTYLTNYIRMADLYLYYAEAANRAWGPNAAPQGINGFTMTALQTVNKVRSRPFGVGFPGKETQPIMPNFDDASPVAGLKVGSVEQFEQKIRNEIRIETAFEEKRYWDLRRWKTLTDQANQIVFGQYIERTAVNKFTYTVVPVGTTWDTKYTERNYLFQIPNNDTFLGPNFKQNPGW